MTAKNFTASLKLVLVHEGGYSNHPKDPGGATMNGVTQRVYDAYRVGKGLTKRSVKSLAPAEREAIYRLQYWDAVQGDKLPAGIDYVVFDGAVNSGPKQSIKWLQRALGAAYNGPVDGVLGMGTLAALDGIQDHDALVDRICSRRLAFLKALKTWPTFKGGWSARINGVRSAGRAMADGRPAAVSFISGAGAKAVIEDAVKSPAKAPGDIATGGGVGAGGTAGALQSLQDQLTPFSSAGDWIGRVVVVLAIAGAVLAIGGLAYRWYAQRREAAINDALDSVST